MTANPRDDTFGCSWQLRLHQEDAGALYLHLPFCVRKCSYCDFASQATRADDPLVCAYTHALGRLVHEAADAGLLSGCKTAYMGGGTPTLAGEALVGLLHDMRDVTGPLDELTCEANPDSLTDDLLAALPGAGCTRLSLGIQSIWDTELAALGRIHDGAQALDRLQATVDSGLDVSCDLMCAIPHQSRQTWRMSLEGVLACGVSHVSVYPLQIEDGTPLADRLGADPAPWNDPDVQADRMTKACELLGSAGLARYEVASYAAPGKECRHNEAYWTGVPYLGLGTSAASMLTREGYARLRKVAPQLPAANETAGRIRLVCTSGPRETADAKSLADLRFEVEQLSVREAVAEDLMLGMRLVRGPSEELVTYARGVLGRSRVDEAFGWCEGRGLVQARGQGWQPTVQGWLLGNELYGRLWDLAQDG